MILGIFHTTITVRDMDESLKFYRDIMGMEILRDVILSGPGMDKVVQEKDVKMRMVWLKAGEGPQIELLHYLNPIGRDLDQKDTDIRAAHICLEVEDLRKTNEYLKSKGVETWYMPDAPVQGGALPDGYFSFHIFDPNGFNLEIKQR